MTAVQPLLLRNPKEDIDRLLLFYESAQFLAQMLAELPPIRVQAKFLAQFPIDAPPDYKDEADLLNRAASVTARVTFPNLSEAEFERLALRFRPFFLNDEPTRFLSVINLLGRMNEDLRPVVASFQERWKKAVFWHRLSLTVSTPGVSVDADELIRVGFYSRYFHLNRESRKKARLYEEALGRDRYWIALVSSVWQRSVVVVDFANKLRPVLLAQEYATEDDLATLDRPARYPEGDSVEVHLGTGSARVKKLNSIG